jgi:hypothetical protein
MKAIIGVGRPCSVFAAGDASLADSRAGRAVDYRLTFE